MFRKKSLGQNFLTAPHYLSLIADTARITIGETVLEIGPGEGVLTDELLKRGARVIAVEKDSRLIPVLQQKYTDALAYSIEIIEEDILHFDISKCSLYDISYKIVANIPYYITGAFLKKFLTEKNQPRSMTLLVQKEVAERIAREKKESILSLSVKAYGEPRYIKTVPSGAFSPPPNVDSAILHIEKISRERFTSDETEKFFFELVRAGFAQKRKLLKRNLELIVGDNAETLLKETGISENARAEDVPLQKWLFLAEKGQKLL